MKEVKLVIDGLELEFGLGGGEVWVDTVPGLTEHSAPYLFDMRSHRFLSTSTDFSEVEQTRFYLNRLQAWDSSETAVGQVGETTVFLHGGLITNEYQDARYKLLESSKGMALVQHVNGVIYRTDLGYLKSLGLTI